MDDYRNRLAAARECYPFPKWAEWGIEQHTDEAFNLFAAVFNRLIERLGALGEQALESEKIAAIRQAVEALNALNEKNEILIETDEREDLCKLFNIIAKAARIDPSKYGNGEAQQAKVALWGTGSWQNTSHMPPTCRVTSTLRTVVVRCAWCRLPKLLNCSASAKIPKDTGIALSSVSPKHRVNWPGCSMPFGAQS